MSCSPKFNCYTQKYKPGLLIALDHCAHQQVRLAPGICFEDGEPLMANPKDPTEVVPWLPDNKLVAFLHCGQDTRGMEEACPAQALCDNACIDVDCVPWPKAEGEGEEADAMQQAINDQITAMMMPGDSLNCTGVKLQRRIPAEC